MEIFDFQGDKHNETNNQQYIISDQEVKTLGITWNPNIDIFRYSFNLSPPQHPITKRSILSIIASIFDPLGLINPCIVKAKVLLQQLWQFKLGWDESIPECALEEWLDFLKNINDINGIEIRRHILPLNPVLITLHGFSDSSEVAYGACIYLVAKDTLGNIQSELVCAKSRLAPLKVISLPRLELCGALLLAQLVQKFKDSVGLNIIQTYYWTDSTIVLSWLSAQPNKWKAFVSNRVAEIQELGEHSSWRHVRSGDNPADIVSRGLEPKVLNNCQIWWHGPPWLIKSETFWPQEQILTINDIPEARKEKIDLTYHVINDTSFLYKYSTFSKLQRVTAYILRFINNLRFKTKLSGQLTYNELNEATFKLCKMVQKAEFSVDLKQLKQSMPVGKSSKLVSLHPFLDKDGLIRVGGRLKHAHISFNKKHPIVLPGKHFFN